MNFRRLKSLVGPMVLLVGVPVVTLLPATAAQAAPGQSDNLSRSATATASYTSPWEAVAAVNDGIDPNTSNDTVNRRWGTWPNTGQQWAQLTWPSAQNLRSADVYFFDDLAPNVEAARAAGINAFQVGGVPVLAETLARLGLQ